MADIDVYDIKGRIVESVTELFDTMLDMEISLADDGTEPSEVDGNLIAGMLSFTGDVVGNFRVEVSQAFARIMTAEMLGMEIDEIEGEDEIKELTQGLYKVFFTPHYVLRKLASIRSVDDLVFVKKGITSIAGHLRDFSHRKN